MTEKTYISLYVDKTLADKLKGIEDNTILEQELLKLIEETKKEYKYYLQTLDEDALIYTAKLVKFKQTFTEIKTKEFDKLYEVWATFNQQFYEVTEKLNPMYQQVQQLTEDINKLDNAINKLSLWKIDDFIHSLEKIKNLTSEDLKLLELFINKK